METPPGFAQYPRPQGLTSGVRALPPGAHIEAIGEAYTLFSREWTTWVAATLVAVGIYIVLYIPTLFVSSYLQYGDFSIAPQPGRLPNPVGFLESFLFSLVPACVYTMLGAGMIKMAIRQIRGLPIQVSDVFSGFRDVPRLIGAYICFAIMMLVGTIFCCIPGLWVMGAFSLTPFLIIDQKMGVFEALGASYRAAGGIVVGLTMFGLLILLSLVHSAGLIACGVGVLASLPVALIAMTIHYYYFFPEAFPSTPTPAFS